MKTLIAFLKDTAGTTSMGYSMLSSLVSFAALASLLAIGTQLWG